MEMVDIDKYVKNYADMILVFQLIFPTYCLKKIIYEIKLL